MALFDKLKKGALEYGVTPDGMAKSHDNSTTKKNFSLGKKQAEEKRKEDAFNNATSPTTTKKYADKILKGDYDTPDDAEARKKQ